MGYAIESAGPLYRRISRLILEEVSAGALRRGDRLPSERALCERFGVSRVTLRRALARLVEEGAVAPSRGSGWYVTTGVVGEPPNTLLSFTELAEERGLAPSARVLSARVEPAALDEAEALAVAPGSDLFHLERLRLLSGVPIALDHSRVPLVLAPGLPGVDFSAASLYRTLELHGVVPARGDYSVEAVAASPDEAALLELPPGAPLLVATQATYDGDGRPIELATIRYRGDRYRFRASLLRARASVSTLPRKDEQ